MMLAAAVPLGTKKYDFQVERYGIFIINLDRTGKTKFVVERVKSPRRIRCCSRRI